MIILYNVFNTITSYNYGINNTVVKTAGNNQNYDVLVTFVDRNQSEALYTLVVNTSDKINDSQQAYIAGYAEADATANLIAYYYQNALISQAQTKINGSWTWNPWYQQYVKWQIIWIQEQIKVNKNDSWWHGIDLILNYWLPGLVAGYNKNKSEYPLTLEDLYILNMQGDMDDLSYFADAKKRLDMIKKGQHHHCTGMATITPDCDDIFFSQDTWTGFYGAFIKIAKTYMFHFNFNQTSHQKVTFSSYPGMFFSQDDFYIVHNQNKDLVENNMAVLETTFHTFNTSLYDQFMDPRGYCTLAWMRIQLSNLFSFTQDDWNKSFANAASWTYNNNYLLLDYVKLDQVIKATPNSGAIERRKYIKDNNISILMTLEVVPGHPKYWDATPTLLQQGFYMSMNTPIDPELYVLSGYEEENKEEGTNYWSYTDSARLCITRARMANVTTLQQFQDFMRYNDWKNDACQKGDSGQSISSRYDLRTSEIQINHTASLFGATDSKVTQLSQSKLMNFLYIVGPIYGGPSNIPKWNFSQHLDAYDHTPIGVHVVLPSVWSQIFGCGDSGNGTLNQYSPIACPLIKVQQQSIAGTVCAIVIPCVVIVVSIGLWAWWYYAKGRRSVAKMMVVEGEGEGEGK